MRSNYPKLFPKHALLLLFLISYSFSYSNVFSASFNDTLKRSKSAWGASERIISFGIGSPNFDVFLLKSSEIITERYNLSSISGSKSLHGKFEFYLRKRLGIVASLNYSNVRYKQPVYNTSTRAETLFSVHHDIFTFNIRSNFHFFYLKKIDFYFGGGTGIKLVKTNILISQSPAIFKSGLLREYEASLGIRYLVKGIVGVYAEVGLGRSLLQGGISWNVNY